MAKRKARGKRDAAKFGDELIERMARCPDAESLNEAVIGPFVAALEVVCAERGYMLNIYGERSNLVFSTEEDAEAIYQIVEDYFATEEEDA